MLSEWTSDKICVTQLLQAVSCFKRFSCREMVLQYRGYRFPCIYSVFVDVHCSFIFYLSLNNLSTPYLSVWLSKADPLSLVQAVRGFDSQFVEKSTRRTFWQQYRGQHTDFNPSISLSVYMSTYDRFTCIFLWIEVPVGRLVPNVMYSPTPQKE